jgi:hypothetical protein
MSARPGGSTGESDRPPATRGDERDGRACGRWKNARATDSVDGTEGVVDHYALDITLPPGQHPKTTFRRLEERLLSYDIFPPPLMRAEVCSNDGRVHVGQRSCSTSLSDPSRSRRRCASFVYGMFEQGMPAKQDSRTPPFKVTRSVGYRPFV